MAHMLLGGLACSTNRIGPDDSHVLPPTWQLETLSTNSDYFSRQTSEAARRRSMQQPLQWTRGKYQCFLRSWTGLLDRVPPSDSPPCFYVLDLLHITHRHRLLFWALSTSRWNAAVLNALKSPEQPEADISSQEIFASPALDGLEDSSHSACKDCSLFADSLGPLLLSIDPFDMSQRHSSSLLPASPSFSWASHPAIDLLAKI